MTVYSWVGIQTQFRQLSASVCTSRLSCHDVVIYCFVRTEHFVKWLNYSSKHTNETDEETFKNETFNFSFASIYAEVTGRIMKEDHTKRGRCGVK